MIKDHARAFLYFEINPVFARNPLPKIFPRKTTATPYSQSSATPPPVRAFAPQLDRDSMKTRIYLL